MTEQAPICLVFDWGDTLMKTNPKYRGVMADWTEVAATPGAIEALEQLSRSYRLVVGTNASDSDAGQIRAALARVGLAPYIDQIYTYHELGARKPEVEFFRAIERLEARPGTQYRMLGDSYSVDVIGAWQAGWPAIWYNPDGLPAPGLYPVQAADLRDFADLPALLEAPFLPGVNTCLGWLVGQNASANLIAHVLGVAAAAYQMALWLRAAGQPIDPLLAHRGGLLHDISKLSRRLPGEHGLHHGELGWRLLRSYGQPVLAEIARRHMMDCLLDSELAPRTDEEKAVYLADKYLEGSQVVSFAERMQGLRQRYPQSMPLFERCTPAVLQLQAEIAARCSMQSEQLVPALRQALRGQ